MSHEETTTEQPTFKDLGLPDALVKVVSDLGYEAPSPIQAAAMPHLLAGDDLVGQAQTGTGKTAAFALPILGRLSDARPLPQALVLTPTRELAIQVAEAFARYGAGLPGFRVLPIYGGQPFGGQLSGLKRGAHVVVGTPGRIIDHLKRGTLNLGALATLVLDEADEMLRMGFVDDVEAVLAKAPDDAQIALFSATMPAPIRAIAKRYLKEPHHITIKSKTTTASNIRQRYWIVSGLHKLDALTRVLEVEPFEAMIIFARTKVGTEELAHRLRARGFAAQALNGDVAQNKREQLIESLKSGQIDLLVATDVAARGLDVERISHVVNYDIPHDTEAYVHRVGRTGRAGRSGDAILFVAPRERHLLKAIEKATRQPLTEMNMPSVDDVHTHRDERQLERVIKALESPKLSTYQEKVLKWQAKAEASLVDIAAALAMLGEESTAPSEAPVTEAASAKPKFGRDDHSGGRGRFDRFDRGDRGRDRVDRGDRADRPDRHSMDLDKRTYWVAVGHDQGVQPGNLVGAIANEGGLASGQIGRVVIKDRFSLIDLPKDLDDSVLAHLKNVKVAGVSLSIRPDREGPSSGGEHRAPREDRPTRAFQKPARKTDRPARAEPNSRAKPSKPLSRADKKAGHQRRSASGNSPPLKKSHRRGS